MERVSECSGIKKWVDSYAKQTAQTIHGGESEFTLGYTLEGLSNLFKVHFEKEFQNQVDYTNYWKKRTVVHLKDLRERDLKSMDTSGSGCINVSLYLEGDLNGYASLEYFSFELQKQRLSRPQGEKGQRSKRSISPTILSFVRSFTRTTGEQVFTKEDLSKLGSFMDKEIDPLKIKKKTRELLGNRLKYLVILGDLTFTAGQYNKFDREFQKVCKV